MPERALIPSLFILPRGEAKHSPIPVRARESGHPGRHDRSPACRSRSPLARGRTEKDIRANSIVLAARRRPRFGRKPSPRNKARGTARQGAHPVLLSRDLLANAWRLSARRRGDFCPRGRASGRHDRGPFGSPHPGGFRRPSSSATSSPFGQPHIVGAGRLAGASRVRGLRGRARGRRPEPHERRNRFASPPGSGDRNISRSRAAGIGAHVNVIKFLECRRARADEARPADLCYIAEMTHERIEMNPEIMGGKPVIRGTRVPSRDDSAQARCGNGARRYSRRSPAPDGRRYTGRAGFRGLLRKTTYDQPPRPHHQ